jgi:hypothetical protein
MLLMFSITGPYTFWQTAVRLCIFFLVFLFLLPICHVSPIYKSDEFVVDQELNTWCNATNMTGPKRLQPFL